MKINLSHIAQRVGWCTGFTFFYFLVIRPLRALYSEEFIWEFLLSSQSSIGNITSAFHSPRQVLITYVSNGSEIVLSHIPQLGFFFLCGMIGLIFLKGGRNTYISLVVFQLIVELFVFVLFWLGIHDTVAGFIISDFLMTYLSPLGCLGFVVYVSSSGYSLE